MIVRTFAVRAVSGPRWPVLTETGAAVTVAGPWELTFLHRDGAVAPPVPLDRLTSWTALGAEATGFSGTARYTVRFDAPTVAADQWLLDLGDVRESARITLNGHRLQTAWSLPFRVPVGDALRAGPNVLEIEVTNLAANEVRARARAGERWDRYFIVDIGYGRFDPASWEPLPSGLLGPVRLIPRQVAERAVGVPTATS